MDLDNFEETRHKYGYKLPKLPELPDGLEWVVHADHDRFTVNLSHCRKQSEIINPDVDDEFADRDDKPRLNGYVMSHTHRHPTVIPREQWETEVANAANHLWTCYTEGNRHAAWADELMRRSR